MDRVVSKGGDIYINKPVSTAYVGNLDLDCHESYCWESDEYFKDVSGQNFGRDYISLCNILMRVGKIIDDLFDFSW
jgi:hypothetical protein